jgi:hypothetical protein
MKCIVAVIQGSRAIHCDPVPSSHNAILFLSLFWRVSMFQLFVLFLSKGYINPPLLDT